MLCTCGSCMSFIEINNHIGLTQPGQVYVSISPHRIQKPYLGLTEFSKQDHFSLLNKGHADFTFV